MTQFHAGSIFFGVVSAAILISPAAANPTPIVDQPVPMAVPAHAGVLDQKKAHSLYNEGDFDAVVEIIETFTRANRTFSKEDSVFIAKHLAVIYTANPATREKGKNYMFRLLDLLPSAKIVDMFVSDEIDRVFEKVREEFVIRRRAMGESIPSRLEAHQYAADRMTQRAPRDGAEKPAPDPAGKVGSGNALYWTAGGVAMVTIAAATTYFLLPKNATDKSYDVP